MINLTPLSEDHPVWVSVSDYNRLKNLKHQENWSICTTQLEWLVKLHFLRRCFKEKRIDTAKFQSTEKELVTAWLAK